jgi:hypothetical protein
MTMIRPDFVKAFLIGAFLLLAGTSKPALADIVTGLPPASGNGVCLAFGCNYAAGGTGEYQQVYTSSLFSGPITITGLDFYNTQLNSGATGMNTGTFTISLSTTSANWNSLSTTPANNIGSDNTQVFSGSLAQAWAFGDTLAITFTTPFTYTPGPGANLLLNVQATGTGDSGGDIYFDISRGNTIFGSYYDFNFGPTVGKGFGLVTGFVTSTPEPGTLALLGFGLGGLAIARRRKA